jgi:hypothetical protein
LTPPGIDPIGHRRNHAKGICFMRELHWHPNAMNGSTILKGRHAWACSRRQVSAYVQLSGRPCWLQAFRDGALSADRQASVNLLTVMTLNDRLKRCRRTSLPALRSIMRGR